MKIYEENEDSKGKKKKKQNMNELLLKDKGKGIEGDVYSCLYEFNTFLGFIFFITALISFASHRS